MKDPKEVDVKELLRRTLEVNVRDAEECVKVAREHGDSDLLQRAEADLMRWQARLAKLQAEADH